jgi:hypothetical protein
MKGTDIAYIQNQPVENDVTTTGVVLGAGVLPITFDQNGELCFLLGREHYVAGWKGSETWSAFEGGTKTTDRDVFHTAAREYIEESLAVLCDNMCTHETIEEVAQALREHDYLFRVTMQLAAPKRSSNKSRYHVTFVVYFPYHDGLVQEFTDHRTKLLNVNGRGEVSLQVDETHAALLSTSINPEVRKVCPDYLEKVMIKLWRLSELQPYLEVNAPKSRDDNFRPCFVRMARLVLQVLQERLRNPLEGAFGEARD